MSADKRSTEESGETKYPWPAPPKGTSFLHFLLYCVYQRSFPSPSLSDLSACYGCPIPQNQLTKKGEPAPLFDSCLANYKTKRYMIRQMKMTFTSIPEKMTPSAMYSLFRYFII